MIVGESKIKLRYMEISLKSFHLLLKAESYLVTQGKEDTTLATLSYALYMWVH